MITTSLAKKKESVAKETAVAEPQSAAEKKVENEKMESKEAISPEQEENLSTPELVQLLKTRLDKSSGYIPDPSYSSISCIHL